MGMSDREPRPTEDLWINQPSTTRGTGQGRAVRAEGRHDGPLITTAQDAELVARGVSEDHP
jgi:hypothetical protein